MVLRADGTEFPAEIAVTRIGVEGPPLFTAYLRDITDQKAAQQALEATRIRLQHLLTSSPTVIYSMAATGDHACSFISENLFDLMGYQSAEHLDDKDFWLERVHPDDKTRVLAEFEDTVPRERGAFEYRVLHKDGGYRWIHDSYPAHARHRRAIPRDHRLLDRHHRPQGGGGCLGGGAR